jgi:hypothetical protein
LHLHKYSNFKAKNINFLPPIVYIMLSVSAATGTN